MDANPLPSTASTIQPNPDMSKHAENHTTSQPAQADGSPPPTRPHIIVPPPASVNDRPLSVNDALGYLDEVKNRFTDRPDVYNQFLDIMKDFKSQALTTPGVIERVSTLFRGHPPLISGFNTFLPPGFRIECTPDDSQCITVITPNGTLTQNADGVFIQRPLQSSLVSPPPQPPPPPPVVAAPVPKPSQPQNADAELSMVEHVPTLDVDAIPSVPIKTTVSLPLRSQAPTPTPFPPPALSAIQPQPIVPQVQTISLPPSRPVSEPPPPTSQPMQLQPNCHPQPAAIIHPDHIVLPPHNPTIATVSPHAPTGNSLVLTPAVALNSSQTTATAASVLGGMHRKTSNPEPPQQQSPPQPVQPAHPPASFHPSLPQAQPPPMATPLTMGRAMPPPQPQPQPEFTHAVEYINRIKTRFLGEPETYKQFLEILQTYQKEQRLLHDVYGQVTQLFRTAPELIDEFKMFLPDTNATPGSTPGVLPPTPFVGGTMVGGGGTVGVMGMVGQPGTPGPAPGQPMTGVSQNGGTEWAMEVQNGKGEKASGYRRKVASNDMNREAPPAKKRRKASEKESRADKEKEREREREKESAPPAATQKIASRGRKPKQHPPRVPEPSSPPFTQYGRLSSPGNATSHSAMHPHPSLPSLPPPLPPPPILRAPTPSLAVGTPPEAFFERVKRALDDRDAWEEFLKLLSLFSTGVINDALLLQMAAPFLEGAGNELELMFRDILGVDRVKKGGVGEMPKNAGHAHGYGPAAGMGSVYLTGPKFKFGPSYRRLPDSETKLACSGRSELCRSVLNDDWVSHPTWASEESGFVAHKKNSFEEALHKSEEERHEYHVQLEAMMHTISLLEPIAVKISEMSAEERTLFRLSLDLGSRSKSIHQKIIKRVYGRENAVEILQSLQDNPAVAVPVVLERLKLIDAEWRKNKREWEKVWREVDCRNFYKSLDHQGVGFKANDKKAITGKALLGEIERIKKMQDNSRDGIVEEKESEKGSSKAQRRPPRPPPDFKKPTMVLPRHQLEYDMQDLSVLQDAIKLTLCFLERNDQRPGGGSNVPQYNAVERRRIEAFLRHYVIYQFGLNPEFDTVFGPPIDQAEWEDLGLYVADDGGEDSGDDEILKARKAGRKAGGSSSAVSAGDLKSKLCKAKNMMETSNAPKTNETPKGTSGSNISIRPSASNSRQISPAPKGNDPLSPNGALQCEKGALYKENDHTADVNDIWLRHVVFNLPNPNTVDGDTMDITPDIGETIKAKTTTFGSFFCNTNFYTLIRLLQLLYSRLMVCKELAAILAKDGSSSFFPNPVAFGLGLTDVAGPIAYFADLASGTLHPNSGRPKRVAAALTLSPSASNNPSLNPAEHFYIHLLDLVEKVFDGELEQTTFEENMRFMFGTRAFVVFSLDKLCAAICKQVQAVVQDGRCHELMNMFEQQRTRDVQIDEAGGEIAIQDIIRYRRQAEALVGSDDLFRVDWFTGTMTLRIQLLDADDLSLDPPAPLPKVTSTSPPATPEAINSRMTRRWKQYVQSYVLNYPTEGRRIGVGRKSFLKRALLEDDSDELADTVWVTDSIRSDRGLEVMIGPGTCKLYYTSGCEEAFWRVRIRKTSSGEAVKSNGTRSKRKGRRGSPEDDEDAEEEDERTEWECLKERAEARTRERKRWIIQFDQGLIF